MTAKTSVTEVIIYGAEQLCASCVHLPSSTETADWLASALARDYGDAVRVRYIDIDAAEEDSDDEYVKGILTDKYAYPLVVINGEVVAEGNPRIKKVRQRLEEIGLKKRKDM